MTIAVDLGRKATKQTNKQKHTMDCISAWYAIAFSDVHQKQVIRMKDRTW